MNTDNAYTYHWTPRVEKMTDEERRKRTATHPVKDWREGIYKGNKMEAPRGDDPIILSKGLAT